MAVSACERFPDRKMRITKVVAQSDSVVVDCEWAGTSSQDLQYENGSLNAGEELKFNVVSFLKFRATKMFQQIDYCTLTT